MTTDEMAILSMFAIGMLSMDEEGRIWRHREISRGSEIGGREIPCEPRRADTGRSKKDEYRRVQVTVGKERYAAAANRIVWMVANQRMIPPSIEVNHIDGVKDSNRPSNLELSTRAGNALHSLHTLGNYQKRPGAKLTPQQVLEIRDLRDRKVMSRAQVAEVYSVSTVTVRNIENRSKWSWLPEATA